MRCPRSDGQRDRQSGRQEPIEQPIETEEQNLRRLIEVARQLGTDNIRIFSFHPPKDSDDYDSYVDTAIDRLRR